MLCDERRVEEENIFLIKLELCFIVFLKKYYINKQWDLFGRFTKNQYFKIIQVLKLFILINPYKLSLDSEVYILFF